MICPWDKRSSFERLTLKETILVVDDKINTLKVMCAILEDEGYVVFKAKNGNEALKIFQKEESIDAVLADLKMPGMDGLELFHKLRSINLQLPFLIMTAHGTIESAVEAMKQGVSNYLIKPLNFDELTIVLKRAIREKKITTELTEFRREAREKYAAKNIIGAHGSMKRLFEMLDTVAPTDAPVLIYGETGTGKELLARAIHSSSSRHDRPMVCINSAALPDNLLEAELFGYKKGAFTGAVTNKKGRLEMADGGTLFLDEIGLMSMLMQTKLLRFLQEGTFDPVGGVKARHVDVRVIAATNKDLNEEIKAQRFLSDLLYRIEVVTMTLPPLRDRGDDLLLLVNHFIEKYNHEYNKLIKGIVAEAVDALSAYTWPGNVRELENCVARCVILAKGEMIQTIDLPDKIEVWKSAPPVADRGIIGTIPEKGVSLKTVEGELIEKILAKCNGNKSKTAAMLGMSRKTLYEKIELHNLKK